MSEENHLITERKQKIADWKALGFAPYAKDFDKSHTAAAAAAFCEENSLREAGDIMKDFKAPLTTQLEDSGVHFKSVAGRIVAQREMGKLAFLSIRDVSGDFQVCLAKEVLGENFKAFLKALDLGDYAGFAGEFFKTKHGEPTLMALRVTPLSKALRPLPEKWHGLSDTESCYRERNLDLISNKDTFKRFKIRSQVMKAVRDFYEDRDFMEVETSILSPQAGGAMAKTFTTHHNALDHDFHLRIALELPLKIVCSGGVERVFEIGKCFRNEGTDPSHLQEFTMLEWYAAYVSFEQNMEWNETMLREIAEKVFGRTTFTVKDKFDTEHEIDFAKPVAKRKFADLLKEYADFDMFTATDEEVKAKALEVGVDTVEGVGRANLLDDIYKKTARPWLIQPTFVLDYPEDLKPLAAPNGDGTASCFQVLIAGWEVINAYGELIDPQVQRALLEKQADFKAGGDDEAMEVDEVFLKAMEHGFPPMAGQGMGIDRIVSLLTGQDNLRDVVLFPTLKPEGHVESKKKDVAPATSSVPAGVVEGRTEAGISRAAAWELVKEKCDWALQRHLVHVAASMEALAVHLGHEADKEAWYITGLLHDIDWNETINNPADHCGETTMKLLADHGVTEEVQLAIQAHCQDVHGVPANTDMRKALLAVDELSGFAVAVALLRPTKMEGMKAKSIVKKIKDKGFAAAVDRQHMKFCEDYFNTPVSEFLNILIPAWEVIAADWELNNEA